MSLHLTIVAYLREKVMKDGGDFKPYFDGVDDKGVMRKLFMSFRGGADHPQGMRLTQIGLSITETYFRAHNIPMPEGYRLGSADLLWLDARAKMPYYVGRADTDDGRDRLVVFDTNLGIKLKLADGMISSLREIEFFQPGKVEI